MTVIDTSVFIDAMFERDPARGAVARRFLQSIEGLTVYVPRVALVELISVAKRKKLDVTRKDILDFAEDIDILSEDVIFDEALAVAENIHPRAIDAYFIATAKVTDSILIANDKTMVRNARDSITAYNLLEEEESVILALSKIRTPTSG